MEWLKNNKEDETTNNHEPTSYSDFDETDGCSDVKSLVKIRDEINRVLKTMKSTEIVEDDVLE